MTKCWIARFGAKSIINQSNSICFFSLCCTLLVADRDRSFEVTRLSVSIVADHLPSWTHLPSSRAQQVAALRLIQVTRPARPFPVPVQWPTNPFPVVTCRKPNRPSAAVVRWDLVKLRSECDEWRSRRTRTSVWSRWRSRIRLKSVSPWTASTVTCKNDSNFFVNRTLDGKTRYVCLFVFFLFFF